MIAPARQARDCLAQLGAAFPHGDDCAARSPIDAQPIVGLAAAGVADVEAAMARAQAAFLAWRTVPAPRRGELVRRLGEALRNAKQELGLLVTLETGKIASEGLG
ncbi:MAG: aldehyde dehydrogenase family protein, partial [Hyphomonadaceae bacterium]|nr:aldehyde dehydrogenase family protein [Hyphomonadaceae bacterium]